MDHQPSAPMNTGATTSQPLHWTTFPAKALSGVRWDDHSDAHRAVMGLFARDLEGTAGARRSANSILYRLDILDEEPTVLIQSSVLPELLPAQARLMTLTESRWHVATGAHFRFRVAVNAVRRNGRQDTERAVPRDEAQTWLANRLDAAVTDVNILNHFRTVTTSGGLRSAPKRVNVDTFDGVGVVADAEALDALRRHGVGRSKSYGCGLLTAQRLPTG